MAVTIQVEYDVLRDARQGWCTVAEDLDSAELRLGRLSGAGLSPLVSAEVDRFVQRWHGELRTLGARARNNEEALALVGWGFQASDREQAERLRSLLPWGARHDAIRQA